MKLKLLEWIEDAAFKVSTAIYRLSCRVFDIKNWASNKIDGLTV